MTTKQQVKKHEETMKVIRSGNFNTNYILDNIDNVDPFLLDPKGAKRGNAFFTPVEIAFHILPWANVDNSTILDLCAGIGVLSFVHKYGNSENCKYICIENNPLFVEIGKMIMPDATWICADVTKELIESLEFDMVISNPPFGAIFEGYNEKSHVAALRIAIENTSLGGTFILPKGTGVTRVRGKDIFSVDYFENKQTEELIKEKCKDRYVSAYVVESFEKGFLHTSSPVDIVDLYMDYKEIEDF